MTVLCVLAARVREAKADQGDVSEGGVCVEVNPLNFNLNRASFRLHSKTGDRGGDAVAATVGLDSIELDVAVDTNGCGHCKVAIDTR